MIRHILSALALCSLMTFGIPAHADITSMWMYASDGGVSNTIGGDGSYNVYLSTNNGASFLNSGNGPSTSIDLSTTTNGTYTYEFYYLNGYANWLTLDLYGSGGQSIQVRTYRNTAASAFWALTNGSNVMSDNGSTVTLTAYDFTNAAYGPAAEMSVAVGGRYSPELAGSFTFSVTNDLPAPAAVPEPASLALLGLGLAGMVNSRRKAKRV